MDQILDGLPNTYTFIDDILKVTKGTETEHWGKVKRIFERLDARNLRLNFHNFKFAESNADSLGFHLSRTGNKPLNSIVWGIVDRLKPKI